jgi:hypothetical protein
MIKLYGNECTAERKGTIAVKPYLCWCVGAAFQISIYLGLYSKKKKKT